MFGRTATLCVVCTNAFDATDRQAVALPCGQNFCLTCLVRLKDSYRPVSPQCWKSFEGVELPAPQKMAKAPVNNTWSTRENNFGSMKQREFVGCVEHNEQFIFWEKNEKEFRCITCILSANMHTTNLERIRDAIPLIEEDLRTKGRAVTEGITSDWHENKEEREKAAEELENINTFKKNIEKLQADYLKFIENIDARNYKLREQVTMVKDIEGMIPAIKSEEDIEVMLSYKKSLEGFHRTTVPKHNRGLLAIGYYSTQETANNNQEDRMKRPVNLLSNIACVFTEDDNEQDNRFIQKLQEEMQRRNNDQHNHGRYRNRDDAYSHSDDEYSYRDDEYSCRDDAISDRDEAYSYRDDEYSCRDDAISDSDEAYSYRDDVYRPDRDDSDVLS